MACVQLLKRAALSACGRSDSRETQFVCRQAFFQRLCALPVVLFGSGRWPGRVLAEARLQGNARRGTCTPALIWGRADPRATSRVAVIGSAVPAATSARGRPLLPRPVHQLAGNFCFSCFSAFAIILFHTLPA